MRRRTKLPIRALGVSLMLFSLIFVYCDVLGDDFATDIPPELAAKAQKRNEETKERNGESQSILAALCSDVEYMSTEAVEERDFVGVISIPSKDIIFPVLAGWDIEPARIASHQYFGGASSADLMIVGRNYMVLSGPFSQFPPGDLVLFMEMGGRIFQYNVRCNSTVLNIYEAENPAMDARELHIDRK